MRDDETIRFIRVYGLLCLACDGLVITALGIGGSIYRTLICLRNKLTKRCFFI